MIRSFESQGNSCKVSLGCTLQFATKPAHDDVDDENHDVDVAKKTISSQNIMIV